MSEFFAIATLYAALMVALFISEIVRGMALERQIARYRARSTPPREVT